MEYKSVKSSDDTQIGDWGLLWKNTSLIDSDGKALIYPAYDFELVTQGRDILDKVEIHGLPLGFGVYVGNGLSLYLTRNEEPYKTIYLDLLLREVQGFGVVFDILMVSMTGNNNIYSVRIRIRSYLVDKFTPGRARWGDRLVFQSDNKKGDVFASVYMGTQELKHLEFQIGNADILTFKSHEELDRLQE